MPCGARSCIHVNTAALRISLTLSVIFEVRFSLPSFPCIDFLQQPIERRHAERHDQESANRAVAYPERRGYDQRIAAIVLVRSQRRHQSIEGVQMKTRN